MYFWELFNIGGITRRQHITAHLPCFGSAFTGKFYEFDEKGTYYCAVCGNPLFLSTSKFATTCGWPSFYQPLRKNSVKYKKDMSHNMERTEVLCGRCDSHLGHIFDDGPKPTGKRFCMNSVCLDFVPNSK